MRVLKIEKPSDAFKNCAFHSKELLNEKVYFLYASDGKKFTFVSYPTNCGKNDIMMSSHTRLLLKVELDQNIILMNFTPKNNACKKITITITVEQKRDLMIMHEDTVSELFKRSFGQNYFKDNQILILQNDTYRIIFYTNTKKEGYINDKTIFKIGTFDAIKVSLVKKQQVKSQLFDPKFNFKDYGLGGLDVEMRGIFMRALASRGLPEHITNVLPQKHVKGVILYGPAGTGKTLIARSLGQILSTDKPKIINGPDVIDKYVGGSEKKIRDLFADAIKDYQDFGNASKLHIFIFDEFDAICKKRGGGSHAGSNVNDNMVNTLLTIIDGPEPLNNIFIIAMTNRLDLIDEAAIRPGRFDIHIKTKLPTYEGRIEIIEIHAKKYIELGLFTEINIPEIARNTENFTGAELESLVKQATNISTFEATVQFGNAISDISQIKCTMQHFEQAFLNIKPKCGSDLRQYKIKSKNLIIYPKIETYLNICKSFLKYNNRLNVQSILIYGEKGSGKTSLLNLVAADAQIPYTKFIIPENYIRLQEIEKIGYLADTLAEARLTNKSLIIIENIEILLDYVYNNYTSIFSSRLFNAFLSLIRCELLDDQNMRIIATSGNLDCVNFLESHFDKNIHILPLAVDDVKILCKQFNIAPTINVLESKTIKQILEF